MRPGKKGKELVELATEFFKVATENDKLHGQWVPAKYWGFLVKSRVETSDKVQLVSSKLVNALTEYASKPTLVGLEGLIDFGTVVRVKINNKRINHRKDSAVTTKDGTKKASFILVETLIAKDEVETEKLNEIQLTSHYQRQYFHYASKMKRRSTVGCIWQRVARSNEPIPPQNRPVTFNVALESNEDIKALLTGIINTDLLARDDLFVDDNACSLLRTRVEAMGCELRKKNIERDVKRFYDCNGDQLTLNAKSHKALTEKYTVPLLLPAIQELLRGIADIAKELPEAFDLRRLVGNKGFGRRLVQVIPSESRDRLYPNAMIWMPELLDKLVHEKEDDGGEMATYHVVSELIRVLSTVDEDAFIDVSRSKALKTLKPKMDALTQKALTFEANLSDHQFKTIRKYLIDWYGSNIFQPMKKVRELDREVCEATPLEFKDGHRKRTCHYRPINKLFQWRLEKIKLRETCTITDLAFAHVLLMGDHGQGAFRVAATLLIFSKTGTRTYNLEVEEDFLVGHIECKKDTWDVLARSIEKPINASLKECGKELAFLKDNNKDHFVAWGTKAEEAIGQGAIKLHTIPVELFLIGDYKFQLCCQGRDGASTYWCPRCKWGKKDWAELKSDKVGPAWTARAAEEQLAHIDRVKSSKRKLTADDRKGFKDKPIFDAIPLENYIFPPLHCVDLFNNSIKDLLDAYIDHRLENRPQEVLDARWKEADMKIEERNALKELEKAETYLQAALELGEETDIGVARLVVEELKAECSRTKTKFGKAAAAARALEKQKDYGAMSQELRQKIDAQLADLFHLLRSNYHGGDMTGNYCRKLVSLAEEVMGSIEETLLSVPREQRADGCDDTEIKRHCSAFTRLFQCMDLLSHFCYQPYGSLTDQDIKDARVVVDRLDRLWRKMSKNTPPKVHGWQHMLEDLERFRGLKYHNESKIEVSHQVGKRTELRFRSMAANGEKKIKATMQYQANLEDDDMKARQAEVSKKRSRNFRDKAKADRELKKTEAKRAKQDFRQSIIDLPEITGEFPSLLDLTVRDRESVAASSTEQGNRADSDGLLPS